MAGFMLIIAVCWVTELFDPPFSMQQVTIETAVILVFACMVVFLTHALIEKIKYL